MRTNTIALNKIIFYVNENILQSLITNLYKYFTTIYYNVSQE